MPTRHDRTGTPRSHSRRIPRFGNESINLDACKANQEIPSEIKADQQSIEYERVIPRDNPSNEVADYCGKKCTGKQYQIPCNLLFKAVRDFEYEECRKTEQC
jgi:hypothetical protein